MTDPDVDKAVRRVVGFAALRRLRRMANAEKSQERDETRWAVRLSWAFGIAAVLTLAWLAFR